MKTERTKNSRTTALQKSARTLLMGELQNVASCEDVERREAALAALDEETGILASLTSDFCRLLKDENDDVDVLVHDVLAEGGIL